MKTHTVVVILCALSWALFGALAYYRVSQIEIELREKRVDISERIA
jgi:hypothetical protein